MDNQQEKGDAIVGVDGFVFELFGDLPEDERTRKRRQVNHMLALNYLPGRKAGRLWLGSKSRPGRLEDMGCCSPPFGGGWRGSRVQRHGLPAFRRPSGGGPRSAR